MKKQLYCIHFVKESKKTSVYTYNLINAELNLCNACERKLRKEISEQIKCEDEIKSYLKKRKENNGRNNKNVKRI